MICIITGDIIGSRNLNIEWLEGLKIALAKVAISQNYWEIFRGDSFQLAVKPEEAFKVAMYIKACVKINKYADVRMGIGFGRTNDLAEKISESNGEAFINSGLAFDQLKPTKINLAIKSTHESFDEEINLYFKLALITMDSWGTVGAEMVKITLENENNLQTELANIIGKSQSSVSEALKRTHFYELMEVDQIFRKKLNIIMNS